MKMMTLKENNEIKDSPRDGDEGYLSEDNNIDDDEEVIELDGLLGTTAVRILVPESLKDKILKIENCRRVVQDILVFSKTYVLRGVGATSL
jgi:hypothetical protein